MTETLMDTGQDTGQHRTEPSEFACTWPGCDRGPGGEPFVAANARGLARHLDWHRGRPTGRLSKAEREKATKPIAAPPQSADLKQIQHELAEGIGAVGALIAGGLSWYKQTRVLAQFSQDPIPVPLVGDLRKLPELETTFGHVMADRAPITARVIMRYAENNATLLKWVVRFTTAVKGGELTDLVVTHGAGLAHTIRPNSMPIAGFVGSRAPGALQEVMKENLELRQRIADLQERMAAAGVQAGSDGRGAGD